MPVLSESPRIQDLQAYVARLEEERGFNQESSIEKCLLLGEEVGELFKAVRTVEGLLTDVPGNPVADELADVLIYVCAIANRYNIDLEEAFRDKEERNAARTWTAKPG